MMSAKKDFYNINYVCFLRLAIFFSFLGLAACEETGTGGKGETSPTPAPGETEVPTPVPLTPPRLPPLDFRPMVSPQAAKAMTEVVCTGSTESPDGADISYSYAWLFAKTAGGDYETLKGATGQKLVIPPVAAHGYVACRMTAVDAGGLLRESLLSVPVAVVNSEPEVEKVETSLVEAYVGSTISCTAQVTDVDGDEYTTLHSWQRREASGDWVSIQGETRETLLVTRSLVRQDVRCLVSAADSLGRSGETASQTVAVRSRPPQAFAAYFQPGQQFLVNAAASCEGETTDQDTDEVSYRYVWSTSEVQDGPRTIHPLAVTKTVSVPREWAHLYVSCQAVAMDPGGLETTSIPSTPRIVENTPPEPYTALLEGTSVKTGDTLSCAGAPVEKDGDAVTITYIWRISTSESGPWAPLQQEVFRELKVGPSLARSYVRCASVASDGYGGTRESTTSEVVYVKNTKPLSFTASLSAQSLKVGDRVHCQGDSIDIDLDTIAYENRWYSSKSPAGPFKLVAGWAVDYYDITANVDPALSRAHTYVYCQKVARDNFGGETLSGESQVAPVVNQAPDAFSASLSSTSVLVGGSVSCLAATEDKDMDPVTLSYIWRKRAHGAENFSVLPNASRDLTVTSDLAHADIFCTARATDGYSGETTSSASPILTVGNTPPEPFGVFITDRPIRTGDTLLCQGTTTDSDTDPLTLEYRWRLHETLPGDGVEISGETSPSLIVKPEYARKALSCSALARDNFGGEREAERSNVVSILNSAPRPFSTTTFPVSHAVPPVSDTVLFSCFGETSDSDEDDISYETRWFTSTSASGSYTEVTGQPYATFPEFLRVTSDLAHKFVRCTKSARDGHLGETESTPGEPSQVINTPPEPSNASLSASEIYNDATLGAQTASCLHFDYDIDLDVPVPEYRWYEKKWGESNWTRKYALDTKTITASPVLAHSSYKCEVFLDDRHGGTSLGAESTVVEVKNSPPSPFSASTSVPSARVLETVSCLGSTTDWDGDEVRDVSYRWYSIYQGGAVTLVAGETGREISYTKMPPGATAPDCQGTRAHCSLSCEKIVRDDYSGVTTSQRSPWVSFVNTAPENFSVSVDRNSVAVGQTFTCSGITTDQDGDPLSYVTSFYLGTTATGPWVKINGADVASTDAQASYTATALDAHKFLRCGRKALDGYGGSSAEIQGQTVTVINTSPVLLFPGDKTVSENQTLSFQIAGFSDVDGDLATYSCQNCPVGTITPSGIFTYSPGYSVASRANVVVNFNVTVRAADGNGGTVDQTFKISVNDVDRLPSATATCPGPTNENATFNFTVTASDPDGDALAVSYASGAFKTPVTVTPNASGATASFVGDQNIVPHTGAKPWTRGGTIFFTVYYANEPSVNIQVSCSYTANDVDRPPYYSGTCYHNANPSGLPSNYLRYDELSVHSTSFKTAFRNCIYDDDDPQRTGEARNSADAITVTYMSTVEFTCDDTSVWGCRDESYPILYSYNNGSEGQPYYLFVQNVRGYRSCGLWIAKASWSSTFGCAYWSSRTEEYRTISHGSSTVVGWNYCDAYSYYGFHANCQSGYACYMPWTYTPNVGFYVENRAHSCEDGYVTGF